MAADSTTAGYLRPTDQGTYDAALEDIFQAFVVGITGLDGTNVRPRWQINPAGMPSQTDNWCSYGMTVEKGDWDAYVTHDPSGSGSNIVQRTEAISVNFSFYGAGCQAYAAMLRDGMSVTQNRDVIESFGIKFVEFADPVTLPVLLKDNWNRREDLKGYFRRLVTRTYAVSSFASADGTIDNESYVTSFSVPHS